MQAHVDASTTFGWERFLFKTGAWGCVDCTGVGALPPPTLAGAWGCVKGVWVGVLLSFNGQTQRVRKA